MREAGFYTNIFGTQLSAHTPIYIVHFSLDLQKEAIVSIQLPQCSELLRFQGNQTASCLNRVDDCFFYIGF